MEWDFMVWQGACLEFPNNGKINVILVLLDFQIQVLIYPEVPALKFHIQLKSVLSAIDHKFTHFFPRGDKILSEMWLMCGLMGHWLRLQEYLKVPNPSTTSC